MGTFLESFGKICLYSIAKIQTNGYALIRRWFVAQFPDFRKNPMAYIDTQPDVLSGKEFAGVAAVEDDDAA